MIPLSSSEMTTWSPPSLANLEPRPVFRFRVPTPRSRRDFRYALVGEGLRYHAQEAVEAEALRAMRALWSGDDDQLRANETRLTTFWETLRQAQTDKTIVIDQQEAETVINALTQISDAWPMLRQMNADNLRFNDDARKIAIGMFVAGWSGLETSFRMENGRIPLDLIDAVQEELDAIDDRAMADKVEGVVGIAFMELGNHAMSLLNLGADTEKNSPSPSLPSGTPDGSTAAGSAANMKPDVSATTPSAPGKRRKATKKVAN